MEKNNQETMNEYGKLIDSATLQFVRILPGSIERVWEYIVDDSKRALWFAGGPTDLNPGGTMKLVFHNSKLGSGNEPTPEKYQEFGDGFESIATIVDIDVPNRLVINWDNGIVTFKLEQLDAEVKLTLTHEKLPTDREQKIGTLAGWHTHLNILVDLLNNIDPKGFWSVHMQLEDEYGRKF